MQLSLCRECSLRRTERFINPLSQMKLEGEKVIESLTPKFNSKPKSKPNLNSLVTSSNIYAEILNAIRRYGGTAKDDVVYKAIRKTFGISYSEFLKKLMVLELRGYINVTRVKNRHTFYIISLRKR